MDRYTTAQERRAFARIFRNLCELGWDLPSHHAHALMGIRTQGPQTLEQEYLWTRYTREMEAETQP
jgi:hypothetical protein